MITLLRKMWKALLYDDVAARRWIRAGLMAIATSGVSFADQLAALTGLNLVWVKILSVFCGVISVAINLGQMNPKEGVPDEKPSSGN